jgi:hypothetical protein
VKPQNAETEFLAFLAKRRETLERLTAGTGLDAMLAFYNEVRAEGVRFDQDGDMLLFQWGIYSPPNEQLAFVFDITRQLIFDGYEDESIWQLGLSFYFAPTEPLIALGSGDRWCHSLAELQAFASFTKTHPATLAVGGRADSRVSLNYQSVG